MYLCKISYGEASRDPSPYRSIAEYISICSNTISYLKDQDNSGIGDKNESQNEKDPATKLN